MQQKHFFSVFVFFVMLACLMGQAHSSAAAVAPAEQPGGNAFEHRVICALPVGKEGVHYAGENIPEMQAWGPAAFSVAPDGSFWVADTAGYRLLHYSQACALLDTLPLDQVVGAGDVKVTRSAIFVLDVAAQNPEVASETPTVFVLGLDGKQAARHELPLSWAPVTGIAVDANGDLLVEREFGARLNRLEAKTELNGYTHQGQLLSAHPGDMSKADANQGYIQVGDLRIDVATTHSLGGLRFLGGAPDGSFYVMAEEVALNDAIQVDQTVRHYGAKGELLGVARVSLPDQYTYVDHGLAVGPDGAVYGLMTRPDRVEIQRLQFTDKLSPILHSGQSLRQSAPRANSPLACVSRDTIMNTAWGIRNNQKYLSSTNTDGACSGRGKPRYIGGAGTWRSVAYDWGGFDSKALYNSYMSPNTYKAGDINTAGVESCSRGLDCSGFVSRAWQLTTKYGTATLPNISWKLGSTGSLLRGDIMNKSGSHVILFESFVSGGMWGLESTTTNSYDRAVYITRTWSALNGYVPRRYNNVCQ